MAMTKKYYEMVATTIKDRICWYRDVRANVLARGVEQIARDLSKSFEADNPKFDRVKFLKACGVSE